MKPWCQPQPRQLQMPTKTSPHQLQILPLARRQRPRCPTGAAERITAAVQLLRRRAELHHPHPLPLPSPIQSSRMFVQWGRQHCEVPWHTRHMHATRTIERQQRQLREAKCDTRYSWRQFPAMSQCECGWFELSLAQSTNLCTYLTPRRRLATPKWPRRNQHSWPERRSRCRCVPETYTWRLHIGVTVTCCVANNVVKCCHGARIRRQRPMCLHT